MGRPGRKAVTKLVPELKSNLGLDFVIANTENAAGGKGITPKVVHELFDAGIDVQTGGNHTWANREGYKVIRDDSHVLRPANYPLDMEIPGKGAGIFETFSGYSLAVLNLQGLIFMTPLDCPFQAARRELKMIQSETKIIIVDFHAEATSEKIAMGWYLQNEVSAIIGTHTHVMTADERVLPGGAAYITDTGMTGAHSGVIGVDKEIILHKMTTKLPVRHKIASDDVRLNGVIVDIDPDTGKARSIERITRKVKAQPGDL